MIKKGEESLQPHIFETLYHKVSFDTKILSTDTGNTIRRFSFSFLG